MTDLPLALWDESLAKVVESLGTEHFPAPMRKLIELNLSFETMLVTQYRDSSPPTSLYHDLDDVQAAISIQFYATGPYLLDPFFQACRSGTEPGAYRLSDLVNEAFFRSEYYRTFYRKVRIRDELGLLIKISAANWIVISLSRGARQPRFAQDDVTAINTWFKTLSAAVVHNWSDNSDSIETDAETGEHLEERLAMFGADRLSPRECEVIRLVLQGHSAGSASAFLGITEGTVKVHRHNAYSKLGVSSQAELFSAATRFLASKP